MQQLNVKVADGFPGKANTTPTSSPQVVIDFSLPEAADGSIDYCAGNKAGLVLGTTGLSDSQRKKIKTASSKIPIVCATNMSVGMNTLFAVVGKVASMLGPDYDIEIVEQHHRFKKDAPSGSALTLAENNRKGDGPKIPRLPHPRQKRQRRPAKQRRNRYARGAGGRYSRDSFGDFLYAWRDGNAESPAHSRDTFVRGALRAAGWLISKKPGLYSMADVLGLK